MVAGASGLVGREILQGLLADESVAAVHSLGRRELPFQHARLTRHRVDFKALPALPSVGKAFIALGATIKVAGSQEAFRAVDSSELRLHGGEVGGPGAAEDRTRRLGPRILLCGESRKF